MFTGCRTTGVALATASVAKVLKAVNIDVLWRKRVNVILTQSLSMGIRKISDITTLSAKFQISIPKSVRAAKAWKAGQRFAFIPKGSGVLLMPVPETRKLAGIAKGANRDNYRDRRDRT